ncbi:HNH endonuclease [Pseudoalteromonas maricaloris]
MSTSWHYDLLLPDAAIEGMQATVKRLDDVTPKIDQHMQQAAQEIGQRVNKALDEYQGQSPIRGVTDKPTKAKADELEPPKGNELPGVKNSFEGTTTIDPQSMEKLNDLERKVKVSDSGKAIIQFGINAGKEKTIILSKKAGQIETRNGITLARDKYGFPIFNSKFDTHVPNNLLGNKDAASHFQYANERLRSSLQKNPSLAEEMGLTNIQLKHFLKDPAPKKPPAGLTWHHHQDTGRMQLVNQIEHDAFVPHTGGMSIWGGGYKK